MRRVIEELINAVPICIRVLREPMGARGLFNQSSESGAVELRQVVRMKQLCPTPMSPNVCLKGLTMTTPNERAKAVTDTRELLQMLAAADQITIDGLIQTVAMGLLRHYPHDADLHASSSVLPELWAAPGRKSLVRN